MSSQLAAKRYAKYWKLRVEVFGPEKAFQKFTQAEALKDDAVALSIGVFNVVGTKDSQGRGILFMDPSKQDHDKYTRESMLRTIWYKVHCALEDEETQRHGLVFVACPKKVRMGQFDRGLSQRMIPAIQGCLPVRVSGFHICHPPTFFAIIFPLVKVFMNERMKKRIQVHRGSDEKVLKALEKYGLTKDCLPTLLGGGIVLDPPVWLEKRREQESNVF